MKRNQYILREKEKYEHLQKIINEISTSSRVVKYITNPKRESTLLKPSFQFTSRLSTERIQEVKRNLVVSQIPYTQERFCEQYNPEPQIINNPRLDKILTTSRLKHNRQSLVNNPRQLDQAQFKTFLQQFQSDTIQHKRSKFETLIERLKEQIPPGEDLNFKKALIQLTPQFKEYCRLKELHIQQMNIISNTEPSKVDQVLKKLGLNKPILEKRRQLKGLNKTQQQQQFIEHSDIKSQRLKTLEASQFALSASQKQFSSLLEQQNIYGKCQYPQQFKNLMQLKKQVKGFYDNIVDYQVNNAVDHIESNTQVNHFMNGLKDNLTSWRDELQSQAEKMERQLADDIKKDVIQFQ